MLLTEVNKSFLFYTSLHFSYNDSVKKAKTGDKMAKKDKTNVMRVLDQNKIEYTGYQWEDVDKLKVESPIYKTLVTQGKSGEHYVFVVPVTQELNLKKQLKLLAKKIFI